MSYDPILATAVALRSGSFLPTSDRDLGDEDDGATKRAHAWWRSIFSWAPRPADGVIRKADVARLMGVPVDAIDKIEPDGSRLRVTYRQEAWP